MASFALVLPACGPHRRASCLPGEQSYIHESLYFGTDRPDGTGSIAPREWAEFLAGEVTPRFPRGFSVSSASGQWRGADGRIVNEASYVLQIVHLNDAVAERAVQEIVSIYKVKFGQEAVLRVKAPACVSF